MKKEIPGLVGYFADTAGNIFGPRGLRRPEITWEGRLRIGFTRDGQEFKKSVHRLILETFVGPCPENMQCRHLDGNPQNNNLENLAWGTSAENSQDSIQHGTFPFGEKNGRAKLTSQDAKLIIYCWKTKLLGQREIAKIFGVSQRLIWNILHGRTWKHITKEMCLSL